MVERKKIGVDAAWEILFDRHRIAEHVEREGLFRIPASAINTVKEARLMAKFDQPAQLPAVFRRHGLSILPVTRGEYVIGPFCAHAPVEYGGAVPRAVPVPDLQSIDPTDLYSEASALLFAFNSGIIHDILQSEAVYFTVNGRMSSGDFLFQIGNLQNPARPFSIDVHNAQVEIDAGYESPGAFLICEAKNIAAEALLIRQLYYPYRLWRSRIAKDVVPLFLVYSNDVFHAFLYGFEHEEEYGSLRLISHRAYTFAAEKLCRADAAELWKRITPIPEPELPFPQANSFARVVDLLSLLFEKRLTREEVTHRYGFDERQTSYYISACEYLGLVARFDGEAGDREYGLSPEGRRIMRLRRRQKLLALMRRILERPVFYAAFQTLLRTGYTPERAEICRLMRANGLSLSGSTVDRRASTVSGWIDWIAAQAPEPGNPVIAGVFP